MTAAEAMLSIARDLADALMDAGYSRSGDDKKRIAQLHTDLCAARRGELAPPPPADCAALPKLGPPA